MTRADWQREAERQQALVSALLAHEGEALLAPWVVPSPAGIVRGLQAYQANAGASAERSLASAFPTVQALVGEDSFATLARAFWHAQPPQRGDLAVFGEALPAFIAASEQLAEVPYLADVARLEWQLSVAERAADVPLEVESLQRLADHDPARLQLRLAPGLALVESVHPVVSLWQAHQPCDDAAVRREAAREALAQRRGEAALVWRAGWRGAARVLTPPGTRWTAALLQGLALDQALARAGEGFVFDTWLAEALAAGWITGVNLAS
jgi:hypothetical protein